MEVLDYDIAQGKIFTPNGVVEEGDKVVVESINATRASFGAGPKMEKKVGETCVVEEVARARSSELGVAIRFHGYIWHTDDLSVAEKGPKTVCNLKIRQI